MSETAKYRHLTIQYCQGVGLDIGSGGNPVVPWAMQVELPRDKFKWYRQENMPDTIELPVGATDLPFKDGTLDFVYSSHLLEDFEDWHPVLREWNRVIKPGGHLVVLVPDKALWNLALRNGQPPNCEHRHESYVGELSTYATELGLRVLRDELTALTPTDYSILFAGRKL